MHRLLASLAVSLTLPLACLAEEPAEPTETVVRMTVQPMAAPKPALKYQLLPELSEMNPGNPVQEYLRCFPDEQRFFSGELRDQRDKWLAMPLKELPYKEVLPVVTGIAANIDFAARLDAPNWQVLLRLKRDGADTVLPDVQAMRYLADVVELRWRAQIAAGRFNEAIESAKTMFAMSRHVAEHPTAVATLVGLALLDKALDPTEEMIQQPECPSLYWAMANVPDPLIDLHRACESERLLFGLDLAVLDKTVAMTDDQLDRAIERLNRSLRWHRNGSQRTPSEFQAADMEFRWRLHAMAKDEARVDAARKRLVESGIPATVVKNFPAFQVVLLNEKRKYDILRDNVLKLTQLPYWQVESAIIENEAKAEDDAESLFAAMAPKARLPFQYHVRRQQRIRLLRCIEALRLYAADHNGKLPALLDDVPVPLPVDPVTGKSFIYKLVDGTASLHGTPPRGKEKDAAFNRRYEVTIQK